MSRPIIVYAYNRPDYLNKTLEALKPQTKDSEVFLFQDGARILLDEASKVKESIDIYFGSRLLKNSNMDARKHRVFMGRIFMI